MKFVISAIVSAVLLIASISGCEKDDKNPTGANPNTQTVLKPLAIGNRWVTDYNGQMNDPAIIDTSFQWNGNVWYGRKGGYSFERNAADGLHDYSPDPDRGRSGLVWKFPVQSGDTFFGTGDGFGSRNWKVISTNATVDVPAGAFDGCVHYQSTTQPDQNVYFKPGVGRVYMEWSNGNEIERLISYSIVG